MHNILFITCNDYNDLSYGGGQCSNRNYVSLKKYANVIPFYISKKSSFKSLGSVFSGYFPPINNDSVNNIIDIIKIEKINLIFFDGSIFGQMINNIREKIPYIKIITFFHNVEFDYVDVRFGRKLRKYIYKYLVKKSELLHLKYSNKVIALNKRDKNRIYEIYKSNVDLIIPITFIEESITLNEKLLKDEVTFPYCLLVGSFKRDTYEGVKWYIENVSKYIGVKTLIVGKGFENKKAELENPNVIIVGTVDSLIPYYKNASFVVLPIFSGAGMKVKTAEALMYGKYIFGTKEAFEGYELDFDKIGGICNTKSEFVKKINLFLNSNNQYDNEYARAIFKQNYSSDFSDKLFLDLLKSLNS